MERAARLRRSLKQAVLLLVVVAVGALAAGWIFAQSNAPSAARLLLGDEVVQEPEATDGPGPDPPRPTSGPARGEVACGIRDAPVPSETQVASLAAGVVIVHHPDDLDAATHRELAGLAEEHEQVLVVPSSDLDAGVEATAWRHRWRSGDIEPAALERFVVGWSDRGPDPAPCR